MGPVCGLVHESNTAIRDVIHHGWRLHYWVWDARYLESLAWLPQGQ
jgi:hypothetical protein